MAEPLSDAGYALMDLDGNEISELLVSTFDTAEYGMIFDLYTWKDGEILHLASGGYRDNYYLCTDYSIKHHGSGGAVTGSYTFYRVNEELDSLEVMESIHCDWPEDGETEQPWYYASGEAAADDSTPISEEEAWAVIDSYEEQPYDLISFADYTPVNTARIYYDSIDDYADDL